MTTPDGPPRSSSTATPNSAATPGDPTSPGEPAPPSVVPNSADANVPGSVSAPTDANAPSDASTPTGANAPSDANAPSGAGAPVRPPARRGLGGRNGLIAAAAAVLAVVLMAWWVWPSDSAKPVARSAAGPYLVQLRVDSAHAGDNTVDLEITDQRGDSAAPDRVSVEPAMPQMGHALPPSTAVVVTPGHYRATVNLPMPGQWEIAVKVSGAPGSGSATFSVQAN